MNLALSLAIGQRRGARGLEDDRRLTDLQPIAGQQHQLAVELLAVDQGPVAGPQVGHPRLAVLDRQAHVAP